MKTNCVVHSYLKPTTDPCSLNAVHFSTVGLNKKNLGTLSWLRPCMNPTRTTHTKELTDGNAYGYSGRGRPISRLSQ